MRFLHIFLALTYMCLSYRVELGLVYASSSSSSGAVALPACAQTLSCRVDVVLSARQRGWRSCRPYRVVSKDEDEGVSRH
jgi:hypothetical protein